MKKYILRTIIIWLFIYLLEIIFNITTINNIKGFDLVVKAFFSLNIACLINTFLSLTKRKIYFTITCIILTLYFYGQFIFYKLFAIPFAFSSISMANQAIDFKSIVFSVLKDNIFISLLYLLPLIVMFIFIKVTHYDKGNLKVFINNMATYFISIMICLGFLIANQKGTYSLYNLYFNTSSSNITINKLGLLTETNLDINRLIFDSSSKIQNEEKEVLKEKEVTYNEIDIDFAKLIENESNEEIKQMHEYFQNEEATKQNAYTGIFKGKNLIVILAEGFNSIAVDEKLTPTLYKMINSSFVFNNFYSPMFLSTTGGEFQLTTGLVPRQDTLRYWKTVAPKLIYSYGNAFNNIGYETSSYHNWTYTYYKRDITMPTLGFTNFKGCKNGLEEVMNCKIWPTSDIEMIDATTKEWEKGSFMRFYITVSGHAEYNWNGNNMARKNKELVDDLPYSDPVKAYLATQIELDRALELLITRLKQAGLMENTVIALAGDHYPYTLSIDEINERANPKRDSLFEVGRSNFILYNPSIKKEEVEKIASNLDVLPTLLNMFGIEYDSRLLMGKDIFGDSEGLVILADGSWITSKGKYNATTGKFTPNKDENISSVYVENINSKVANKISLSNLLVKHNYYTIIEESRK